MFTYKLKKVILELIDILIHNDFIDNDIELLDEIESKTKIISENRLMQIKKELIQYLRSTTYIFCYKCDSAKNTKQCDKCLCKSGYKHRYVIDTANEIDCTHCENCREHLCINCADENLKHNNCSLVHCKCCIQGCTGIHTFSVD